MLMHELDKGKQTLYIRGTQNFRLEKRSQRRIQSRARSMNQLNSLISC